MTGERERCVQESGDNWQKKNTRDYCMKSVLMPDRSRPASIDYVPDFVALALTGRHSLIVSS